MVLNFAIFFLSTLLTPISEEGDSFDFVIVYVLKTKFFSVQSPRLLLHLFQVVF